MRLTGASFAGLERTLLALVLQGLERRFVCIFYNLNSRAQILPNPPLTHPPTPPPTGSKAQVAAVQAGLLRLDHLLLNVTHEQRHLYARTARHLQTAKSTLARAFWYYLVLYAAIAGASFSQLAGVRLMFRKSRKQGLII